MFDREDRMIAGIGETVLDILFRNGQPQAAVPGGSVFNAMVSLGRTIGRSRPGTRLLMLSQTGDDAVAGMITSFMKENGLDSSGMQQDHGQSTVSMAMLDERNNASYEFFRDPGLPRFRTPEVDFRPGDILLFGSYFAVSEATGPQTRELVRAARKAGAIVYYDINFRKNHPAAPREIEENMGLSDIVRGSSEDIEGLYGSDDASRIYREHISALCPRFICTRGADPAEVFSPGVHAVYPTAPVEKLVSTVGAGDNFNAGIIHALVQNKFGASQLQQLTRADWDLLVPTAMRFSAAVCGSIHNYVDII